jgi:23S rRNA (guanosine2251-2'-O)-methyltransferase
VAKTLGGDVVPGFRAVRELLTAESRPVRKVLIDRERTDDTQLLDLASDRGIRVELVDGRRIDREARIETHQGVVAIAGNVRDVPFEDLCNQPDAFLVVLDGVTDPRNLGAVLRTAEVAGATGAVVTRHRGALLGPAAVKAAAGAIEYLPIALVAGVPNALEQASRIGVWSVGLDATATTSVSELPVADAAVMLVLGAEGRGLARLTRDRCDLLASIPMYGHLESLNVSAAAAVACFEIASRRHSR